MGKITYPNGDTPKICIVGAGVSGLGAAIQLKKQLNLETFTIFEVNSDIGGTWFSNFYPGCACDVQSHLYSYSFELNPDWPETFSSQSEIWKYLKNVARKYNLYPHIKFETSVKSLTWNEPKKQWKITTVDKNLNKEEDQWFDLVINGPGALRQPNIPEMFNSFKGPMLHSGAWDSSIDLNNKVVGVVGSGASAIQIIPSIAKTVKELHVFQRQPAWVLPRPDFKYPTFLKTLFKYVPLLMYFYRCIIFLIAEFLYPAFKKDSWMGILGVKFGRSIIRKHFAGDEEMIEKLTPNYAFGCKRLLLSNDYYPTLKLPHVTVHSNQIKEVASHGIVTRNGDLKNLDVLILATGFRVHDYFAPMEIYGRNSENVLKAWQTKYPMHYYGIVGHGAPNHFGILGPNTGLGHNGIMIMIESQINFSIQLIREMMLRNTHLVCVRKSVENDFMDWIYTELKNTVWGSTSCGSWYLNEAGVATTLWPKNCISYWMETRKVNFSNFIFE